MGETRGAIVETSAGKVEGRYQEGLFVLKGVPFAAPPVGPLRWMPPEAVKPWQGVRPAFEFGGVAPQVPLLGVLDVLNVAQRQDEDCLYLNAWTPRLENHRRPCTWIHGGAFNMGSGSQPFYEGRLLALPGECSHRHHQLSPSACWVFSTWRQPRGAGYLPLETKGFSTRSPPFGGCGRTSPPSG